jgi:hypothetical protein
LTCAVETDLAQAIGIELAVLMNLARLAAEPPAIYVRFVVPELIVATMSSLAGLRHGVANSERAIRVLVAAPTVFARLTIAPAVRVALAAIRDHVAATGLLFRSELVVWQRAAYEEYDGNEREP